MIDYPPKHPLPAALSFFFPGLGQIIKGEIGKGLGFFLGSTIGFFLGIFPGLILWMLNIHDAYHFNPPTPVRPGSQVLLDGSSRPIQTMATSASRWDEEESRLLPPRVGAHKFWGMLFGLGAIAMLAFTVMEGLPLLNWSFWGAGLPMSLGGLLWFMALRREAEWREKKQQAQERKWEKEILRCAQRHGGRLTAPRLVMETSLSLDEAQKQLEALSAQGHVGIGVSESGALVYEFYELVGDSDQEPVEHLLSPLDNDEDKLWDELSQRDE